MPCEVCTRFSQNAAFGEALTATPASFRRTTMIQSRKSSLQKPSQAALSPRQISITFESRWLQGLEPAERMKALAHLAHLLMLAAGVAIEERDDEP
jgi:hypothetical protein